ncbi:hypothetical protein CEXT_699831 [Caerostris extrusa]|uniref:Uncharacterized protein n=1 Tax=Caerostris extrusa TaxID=172846 RepID=A0AAV4W156_CAEEX|nr:hypothetical protein CEXT_699831 [Caerostris extrusa]
MYHPIFCQPTKKWQNLKANNVTSLAHSNALLILLIIASRVNSPARLKRPKEIVTRATLPVKSDLDIMSLKGKIQQRFDLVIGRAPSYFRQVSTAPNPHFTPQVGPYFVWEKQAHYLRCLPT